MIIGRIEGATRVLGKSQGYLGLPLKDVLISSTVDGPETPAMETAWIPNPDEIERFNTRDEAAAFCRAALSDTHNARTAEDRTHD